MSETGGRGWVTAAVVLVAVLLLCSGVVGVLIYGASTNPSFKKGLKIVGKSVELAKEVQNAPGALELRGAGCMSAAIVRKEKLAELMEILEDDPQRRKKKLEQVNWDIVTCTVRQGGGDDLTCNEVARIYGEAAPDEEQFMIMIQEQGDRQPRCSGIYGQGGGLIRALRDDESVNINVKLPQNPGGPSGGDAP